MAARRVLMVQPVGFRANPETAADNLFQMPGTGTIDPAVETAARTEFEALHRALEERGIEVVVHAPSNADTPDAVFPNNWFSTTPVGMLVLYPMLSPARRAERRPEFVAWLRRRYPRVVDLTAEEADGRYLEGTGSLVIDARSRIVYASVSRRTDRALVQRWAERFDHAPVIFRARDRQGRNVYHTNVVMGLGSRWAVVCAEAVRSPAEREGLLASLTAADRQTVAISLDQMHDFCGNVLELENGEGEHHVVMSERAYRAFRPEQLAILGRHAEVLHVDLTTIETHGGGSARCMLAELF